MWLALALTLAAPAAPRPPPLTWERLPVLLGRAEDSEFTLTVGGRLYKVLKTCVLTVDGTECGMDRLLAPPALSITAINLTRDGKVDKIEAKTQVK